ncbi:MAG: gamma-glutamyl-gamma-aminobutyrate hydrolase family protein [Anaerolineales bacterium]
MTKPLIGITCQRRDWQGGKREVYGQLVTYSEAVHRQGGLPVLLPLGVDADDLREIFARLDGVVLTGGGDIAPHFYGHGLTEFDREVDEDRDQIEINLARWASAEEKPLLAICRGVQILNVALGGTLIHDIAAELPGAVKHDYFPDYPRDMLAHPVQIEEGSRLAEALRAPIIDVNSLHHQALLDIASELHVVGHAPDGVIEGVEIDGHPFAVGVQWHPEWLQDNPEMRSLFAAFVRASSNGSNPA